MDEFPYQSEYSKVKRRNHIIFGGIVGGLAALAIGAKVYATNLDTSSDQRRDLLSSISGISTFLISGASYFFTIKEYEQLEKLKRKYYGDEKDL